MPDPEDFQPDGQDQAEVFDEENITEDGRDIATSDLQRDVYDVTRVAEDSNEALEPEDDFDPDAADEAELEEILGADEDLDRSRTLARDNADLVADEDISSADLEAGRPDEDLETLSEGGEEETKQSSSRLERALDEALEETFPASDPVSISPSPD